MLNANETFAVNFNVEYTDYTHHVDTFLITVAQLQEPTTEAQIRKIFWAALPTDKIMHLDIVKSIVILNIHKVD